MSSVPPARSTRVGARDSILNVPCFPSFQDLCWRANHNKGERCAALPTESNVSNSARFSRGSKARGRSSRAFEAQGPMNCGENLARGGAKLADGFFFCRYFFVCEVRLKAAPATRFVHSCGSHYDQIFGGDQTLLVHGGVSWTG